MNTNKKIKRILNRIGSYIDPSSKADRDWYNDVEAKASTFKTKEEELEYLEGILADLRPNIWPGIVIGSIIVIGAVALYFLFLAPKSANAANSSSSTTTASSTISSADLPKEDFQIIDYKVDGENIVYNSSIANVQHKVFANSSVENSLSANAESAVNEMVQYMSHNAVALKEKAMTFGIINTNTDVKDWLVKGKDGKIHYNDKGKDVFYQTKAFITRSQLSSKKMEGGSNYYTTGVNDKGDVVISRQAQNLSGQEYIEVSNPKDSNEKYSYRVLVYCGNTVMQRNDIPGIPTENIEIPKPKKPNEPDKPGKPSEPKNEQAKKPELDPANQGKAPVGGGQNDGSSNGSETSQASLPEQYSAPAAPTQSSPSTSGQTTPSQDSRISEPSQWSGAGTVTDSNGSTKVEENGAVTTPDGRKYDGLVGKSAPKVESGANDTTKPSSSANFAGANGSMSRPAIDD